MSLNDIVISEAIKAFIDIARWSYPLFIYTLYYAAETLFPYVELINDDSNGNGSFINY